MAFLVVLESMTPAERVAFILHEVFRYSFAEVAEITGRTPAACRQLASSARRRIRASQAPATPAAHQADVVKDFKQAWEAKDIDALGLPGCRRARRTERPRGPPAVSRRRVRRCSTRAPQPSIAPWVVSDHSARHGA
jgi:Sigma-70, region 4